MRVCVAHMTVANWGQTGTAHLLVPMLGSVHEGDETLGVGLIWVSLRLEQFPGDLLEMV